MDYEVTWIGSPNWRTRTGQIKYITLHWMVGRLAGTDAVFQRYPGTATHYGIAGTKVHQYVTESRSAPGTGTNRAIPYDIGIEHEGGWLLPDGSRYKPSPTTHQTSAELCADIAKRHGLGRLIVGRNVFRHRDWVATMCPGNLDVEWIVAKANSINGFGTAPAGGGTQIHDPEVRWIQQRLVAHWFDPGDIDGIWGPQTEAAVVAFQSANNLEPDGVVGPLTREQLEREKDSDMRLLFDTKGIGYLITDDGSLALPNMQVYNLFRRLINSNQTKDKPEVLLPEEVGILNNHLRLLALSVNTQTTIDPDKLAAAISDALGSTLDPEVIIDPEVLANALDIAVPRIARAVVAEHARKLGLPE